MYKVFFVDDEASMRAGIRNNINWDSSIFTLAGEAPDGEMALSLMQEILPDILITDVHMPFINGIDLARRAKKIMPWIKIIILSGHDEFEYAKQAISIGVEEYLLKPITSEELMGVLTRTAERIEDEKKELKNNKHLERLINDTKKLKEEKLLSDLVYGNIDIGRALILTEELGLNIEAEHYLIMLIELRAISTESYDFYQSARSLAFSVLAGWENSIFFSQGLDKIVCILKGKEEDALEEEAYACAQAVKYDVERSVACSVSVAIGSIISEIGEWTKSLADAEMVKRYLSLVNRSQIVSIRDISSSGLIPFAEIDKLPTLDKLRYTSKTDIPKFLDDYFNNFIGSSMASFLFMNYIFVDILMASSKLIEELGGNINDCLSEYANMNSILAKNPSVEDFKRVLTVILERIIEFRDSRMGSKYNGVIAKAQEYIQQNFAQQGISLHSVAKEVNVSPNHFSTVFSQETGETFISYMTKLRIDHAKTLLKTTAMRTSDIGYEVGYNDTHYFSYVFKKHVGMTPKEFRK